MGTAFWIRRFVTVLAIAGVIVAFAQWAKGHTLEYAGTQGAIWGFASATVFTVARILQSRRKQHCAICKDTPEMAHPDRRDA
jgi:membrane associated rhomboid family serine protease